MVITPTYKKLTPRNPKMFKSIRDFSIFVLREWVDNMISKDPELAKDLDFSDFY